MEGTASAIAVMPFLLGGVGAFAQTRSVLGFGCSRYVQLVDNTATSRLQPNPSTTHING
jgi:hypothetical protein